jgi:alkylation response protein AidB-like acyl-CoA dehydrogenase
LSDGAPGELQPTTTAGARLLSLLEADVEALAADAAIHDAQGTFAFGAFESLRERGVLGATVPVHLGGLGVASVHDLAVALGRLARVDASVALALHMQLSRGMALGEALSADRRGNGRPPDAIARAEGLLRGMARGETIVCAVTAEPGRGYAHVTTELTRDASGWKLDGHKIFCTLAPLATHFVVRCRAPDPESRGRWRIASALTTREVPGLTVGTSWDGLGMRASGSPDVRFDACHIADEHVELRAPWGTFQPRELLGRTRRSIAMLGIYVGIAEAARDATLGSLRKRGNAARPPAHTIASIEAQLFAIQATLERALREVDDLSAVRGHELAAEEETGFAAMNTFQRAKLVVNAGALAVVEQCMTLAGGASYVARHPLARHLRDVHAGPFMHPYPPAEAAEYIRNVELGLGTAELS